MGGNGEICLHCGRLFVTYAVDRDWPEPDEDGESHLLVTCEHCGGEQYVCREYEYHSYTTEIQDRAAKERAAAAESSQGAKGNHASD